MAVVVVRYFGGTLLGVPGLIQAYKTATSLVLQTIPIIQKPVLINYEVQFDYTMMNDVMQVVRQCHCEVISQEIQLLQDAVGYSQIQAGTGFFPVVGPPGRGNKQNHGLIAENSMF